MRLIPPAGINLFQLIYVLIREYRERTGLEPLNLSLGNPDGVPPAAIRALKSFQFEERNRTTLIIKEPIGVCALITPWNWPVNQVACKVAPALAAGCIPVGFAYAAIGASAVADRGWAITLSFAVPLLGRWLAASR